MVVVRIYNKMKKLITSGDGILKSRWTAFDIANDNDNAIDICFFCSVQKMTVGSKGHWWIQSHSHSINILVIQTRVPLFCLRIWCIFFFVVSSIDLNGTLLAPLIEIITSVLMPLLAFLFGRYSAFLNGICFWVYLVTGGLPFQEHSQTRKRYWIATIIAHLWFILAINCREWLELSNKKVPLQQI